MMMMMSGFVERVINNPQTRCRSAKRHPDVPAEGDGRRVAAVRDCDDQHFAA